MVCFGCFHGACGWEEQKWSWCCKDREREKERCLILCTHPSPCGRKRGAGKGHASTGCCDASWHCLLCVFLPPHWPTGKASASEANPACARIFSGSSHTSDLKIGTLVAALPGAWRYRVSAGTGQPGVSIL